MDTIHPAASYKFYAFISYKRADSKWADWLYRNLQSYRLPGKLCRRHHGLPKRLCPIFLDKEDLIPGNLGERLKEHIATSKYFIAICSRNTQNNPQYIDMELQYFLETHDNDYTKVIPFIVDDSPRPEQDCFSPQMQLLCAEHQLIGVNVSDKGRRRAFLKVIAAMHGIDVSEIESADDKRRRKNAILTALLVLTGICLLAFGVNYWWQHIAVHTDYYTACIWADNLPQGVGKIEKNTLADYARIYRIEHADGLVRAVYYQNEAGTLVPPDGEETVLNQGASKIEFTYTGEHEKRLYTAKYYDHNSLPIVCCQYSADGTHVTLLQDESSGISAYVQEDIGIEARAGHARTNERKTTISRYVQELDADGRLIKRCYTYGEDYIPISDGNGIYGYRLAYDTAGNLTEVSYFSTTDAALAGETSGISTIRYSYNDTARVRDVRYFDAEDNPVNGPEGWAQKEYSWHENGNVEKLTYKGADGEPTTVKGYASLVHEYKTNALSKTTYYGIDGSITPCENGYAAVTYQVDEIGEIISYRYLNADGSPAIDQKSGTYGQDIRKTAPHERYTVYVDQNGAPMMTLDGYAYAYTTQDEFNYPLRIEYRDADNRPRTDRYAACTYQYDEIYHKVTAWRFWDASGEPTINTELGFAALINEYDSRGFATLTEYRDMQENLCNNQWGYAKIVASRVPDGTNLTETMMFYDAEDKPVIHDALHAYGYESAYYENGKLAGLVYLNENKRPYYHEENGFAGVNYLYDEYGYISMISYFGENLRDIMVDGFARMMAQHDAHGNMLTCEYYNDNGDFAVNAEVGYAGMVATYENDRLVAIDYYGVENAKPVLAVNPLRGYASVSYTYADDGSISGINYYGAENGELIPMVNAAKGYAAVRYTTDTKEMKETTQYYGAENGQFVIGVNPVEGYAGQIIYLNERGDITEVHYFDEHGKYMNHLHKGYAAIAFLYDENGEFAGGGTWVVVNGELVLAQ